MYLFFNFSIYSPIKLILVLYLIFVFGCTSSAKNNNSNIKNSYNTNNSSKKDFPKIYGNYLSSLAAKNNLDFSLASYYALKALNEDFNNTDLLKHAFDMLLFDGQFEKASEISSRLELHNESIDNFGLWPTILVELKQNDLLTANEIVKNLNFENYERFFSYVLSSWFFAVENQKAKSISNLDKLIAEVAPGSSIKKIQVQIQKIYVLSFLNNSDEALKLINTLLNEESNIPTKYIISIAKIMSFFGKKDAATLLLINNLPTDYDIKLAVMSLNKPNIISPIQALSIALEDTGTILAIRKGWYYAFPLLRMAVYLDKNNFHSKLIISSILQSMKRYNDALNLLNNNNNYGVYKPLIFLEKAYLEEDLGNDHKVITILKDLSKNPDFKDLALIKLSNFFIRKEKFEDALIICDELILNESANNEVYYYRALSLVSLKDWDKAIKALDMLLEKIPNNSTIMNFVGYTFVDRNIRLNEGLNLIEKAIKIEPNNGFFIDSLGWAYYRMGKYKEAIKYIEKSVELEPQEAEISDHLGDAYYKLNRIKEAIVQWKRALSLNTSNAHKEEIRKKIIQNEK